MIEGANFVPDGQLVNWLFGILTPYEKFHRYIYGARISNRRVDAEAGGRA